MITKQSTPEEIAQIKERFKQELKDLMEKYNVWFSVNHEGDMHGVDCHAEISLGITGTFREIIVVEKHYSSYIGSSDIK